jgi:DNA-binding PadR family transcriptional regulator
MARRAETIELAVLGLLHEGPMHGYELREAAHLDARLGAGPVVRLSLPALEKMLRADLIKEPPPRDAGPGAAHRLRGHGTPGTRSSSG